MAQPRVGHLQQCPNIFYYIKNRADRSWLPLDPTGLDVNWVPLKQRDLPPQERALAMRELYPDACDETPPNMLEPRGLNVEINAFVDADHACNSITMRSHTGIILLCNMAPVSWYSR